MPLAIAMIGGLVLVAGLLLAGMPGESAAIGGGSTPTPRARAYRITVRASGIRASTVVMLQAVYVKQ